MPCHAANTLMRTRQGRAARQALAAICINPQLPKANGIASRMAGAVEHGSGPLGGIGLSRHGDWKEGADPNPRHRTARIALPGPGLFRLVQAMAQSR